MSKFEHFFNLPYRALEKAFYTENVGRLTQSCKILDEGDAGQLQGSNMFLLDVLSISEHEDMVVTRARAYF